MRNTRTETGLIAHSKALEAAGIAIRLVLRVPAPLKCLADQVIRSASSVPANLSEGHGRSGRDRNHHWRIAYASAKEVDTHLRLLTGARPSTEHTPPPPSNSSTKSEPSPGGCSTQSGEPPTRYPPWRAGNPAPTGCQVRHCAGTLIRRASPFAQCRTWLPRRAPRGQFSRLRGRPPACHRRGRRPCNQPTSDHADGATL